MGLQSRRRRNQDEPLSGMTQEELQQLLRNPMQGQLRQLRGMWLSALLVCAALIAAHAVHMAFILAAKEMHHHTHIANAAAAFQACSLLSTAVTARTIWTGRARGQPQGIGFAAAAAVIVGVAWVALHFSFPANDHTGEDAFPMSTVFFLLSWLSLRAMPRSHMQEHSD
eukprot:TRINITY_DN8692_c3_g1_i1.p1 TRINITY_DN8692_c3_g1~~TRINITY_DN8692_c3_g1_i1.p1  ORF type:complete len:197 (+),score=68.23 TRINITY_DN8692_c3_g1_i1:85-591(+)